MTRVDMYADLFEEALKETVQAAKKVPESNRFRQAAEGKSHPVWLLGHMCYALDFIVNHWTLGGELVLPRHYFKTFAPSVANGKPITTNAEEYPAWEEIIEQYKVAGRNVVVKIRSLSDNDLAGPSKGDIPEQYRPFFGQLDPTLKRMLMHDNYHRGQMNLLANL